MIVCVVLTPLVQIGFLIDLSNNSYKVLGFKSFDISKYQVIWCRTSRQNCKYDEGWLLVQAGRSPKNLHHPLPILLERIPPRISQPEHGMRLFIDKLLHDFNITHRFQFAHVR